MSKRVLEEKALQSVEPVHTFEESFRTAIKFWQNPYELWHTGGFEDKLVVVKLAFSQKLSYVKNEGFRTFSKSAIAEPLRLCWDMRENNTKKYDMARLAGIEPATPGSGNQCSIH